MQPNNSFKPNLFRYGKSVAEKACHAFASTTQVGLTQALEPMARYSFSDKRRLVISSFLLIVAGVFLAWYFDPPSRATGRYTASVISNYSPNSTRQGRSQPVLVALPNGCKVVAFLPAGPGLYAHGAKVDVVGFDTLLFHRRSYWSVDLVPSNGL